MQPPLRARLRPLALMTVGYAALATAQSDSTGAPPPLGTAARPAMRTAGH